MLGPFYISQNSFCFCHVSFTRLTHKSRGNADGMYQWAVFGRVYVRLMSQPEFNKLIHLLSLFALNHIGPFEKVFWICFLGQKI